jgi:hypothetical protein
VRAPRDRSLLRGAPGSCRTPNTADEALLYRAEKFESREEDHVQIKKIYSHNILVRFTSCALFFVVCGVARAFLSLYLLRDCTEPFTKEWWSLSYSQGMWLTVWRLTDWQGGEGGYGATVTGS